MAECLKCISRGFCFPAKEHCWDHHTKDGGDKRQESQKQLRTVDGFFGGLVSLLPLAKLHVGRLAALRAIRAATVADKVVVDVTVVTLHETHAVSDGQRNHTSEDLKQ